MSDWWQLSGQRAATVVYRALLDSILKRAQTKAYSHGSRYLRKLDRLAEAVDDWGELESHAHYVAELGQKHRRKHSFWSRDSDNLASPEGEGFQPSPNGALVREDVQIGGVAVSAISLATGGLIQ